MSQQEENEIIGKLISDYGNAKRQRELIRVDLYSAGCILSDIGNHLKGYAFDEAFTLLDRWNSSAKPELHLMIERMNAYRDLSAQVREYEKQIQALGIKHLIAD